MGFDLNIEMCLHMCPDTGKPYYYGKNFEKVYEIPSLEIPNELKPYLEQRGHYLHAYTFGWNEEEIYSTDLESFLEEFPDWEDVVDHPSYDEYWTEEDHNKFKKLLIILSACRASFRVSWSY